MGLTHIFDRLGKWLVDRPFFLRCASRSRACGRSWTPQTVQIVNKRLQDLFSRAELAAKDAHLYKFAHEAKVTSVAWDRSGERLATGSWDSCARVFNVVTGAEEQKFAHAAGCSVSGRGGGSGHPQRQGRSGRLPRRWDICSCFRAA